MCSVPDEDGLQEMTPVAAENYLGSDVSCRKCHQQPVEVVLHRTDPYCRDCFLAFATHKFRSCIGKHKALPAGCSSVVGISGGPASSALAHLVHRGITLNTLKKLRLEPVCLHIDEHCSPVGCRRDVEDTLVAEEACRAVLQLGLKCYYTTLETVFSQEPVVPVPFLEGSSVEQLRGRVSSPELQSKLCRLLDSCTSLTAKESVWQVLVQQCLVSSSAALGHTRLMLGSCASSIAADILSYMAQGRGAHIPQHVSFRSVDSQWGVEVYRPLRELLLEELLHYNRLMDVPFVDCTYDNKTVTGCTHNFLSGLQAEFPSTIPTVFRTGDKLLAYDYKDSLTSSLSDLSVASPAPPTPVEESDVSAASSESRSSILSVLSKNPLAQSSSLSSKTYCGFCHSILDTNQPEASAMAATIVSQRLSKACSTAADDERGLGHSNGSSLPLTNGDVFSSCETAVDFSALGVSHNSSSDKSGEINVSRLSQVDLTKLSVEKINATKEDLDSVLCYGCRISLLTV
ncbi:Cytoplasmic tRNA 2-thiolation protein 2, partial [Trinorchestia longiramus]